jgi:outer membrane biosynthesis protein TonB
VNESDSYDQELLTAQLERSRERLNAFELELQAVESELEERSTDRQRFQLLHEVCGHLEKLSELGGEELFWEGLALEGHGSAHVYTVRRRLDEFDRQFAQIEGLRRTILEKIRGEKETSDYIEEDLFEAQREEEERRLEWVVERNANDLPGHPTVMPWTRGDEADQRFRKSLAIALLSSLFFGFLFPFIDLPALDPWEQSEVPERFTRLIKEEPLPPPKVEQKIAKTKPESSDEPVVAEEKVAKPEPAKKPKAETKGILAFREEFSSLAENTATSRLGAHARINRTGDRPGARAQRDMVATQAAGSSGGINLSTVSRDIGGGGGQIAGVEVTQATSAIGEIGGEARPLSGGPGPARMDEEIQIVFDRHKAALYRLYNRELRRDPTLQGQIVLRIKIEPDGSVSLCEVESSNMKAPKLGAQVVSRVKTFDFGAKEGVPTVQIIYPIDFLPAS